MTSIAINGMGRIGRIIARRYTEHPPEGIDLVAANDLCSTDNIAYLMRYDSVHGRSAFPVRPDGEVIRCGSRDIRMYHQADPAQLPWEELGVDIVLECTGLFRDRTEAAKHIGAGASKVIISAPSSNVDRSIVLGVNEGDYDPRTDEVVSAASCTTNSLAPVAKVLDDAFGIELLMATTIHSYTSSQKLVDSPARKKRRGRAAALSLVPTSTGAANATVQVMPRLEGRVYATAMRVPIPDGAITDITAMVERDATEEEVNRALRQAAEGPLEGILGYSEEDLVSIDIIGDSRSSIVDAPSTKVLGRAIKVMAWYDNEYGYSCRMLDLAAYLAGKGWGR